MNRALDDMQHQGGLAELPTRKTLETTLLAGIAVFAISFVGTWYRVWWDSIIGLLVTAVGYYSIRDVGLVPMGLYFDLGYYGAIFSFLLHGIAFGVIAAELSTQRIESRLTGTNETPSGLLIFVLVIELILLGFSGAVMGLFYRLRKEISDVEVNAAGEGKDYKELV
ncbi:Aste57867_19024 [Aphanomyces stellatus]|uniref:Aste57867_19024 protein n=1 Tax=Aphanomyces stellatus TaxID=120398 RepID=A0A485LFU6_9STRA|nr:hypothetical protein As57867_018960 [Aphanomyces stellatus]VFT95749.1 Aste57867_19024 [Aphanomyces stellatus]